MSHWYDSTPKKSRRTRDSNPGSSALEADALPLGQRGGFGQLYKRGTGVPGIVVCWLLHFPAACWSISRIDLVYLRDRSGVSQGSIWCISRIDLEYLKDRSGVSQGSIWSISRIDLEYLKDRSGVSQGSIWCISRIDLVYLKDRSGVSQWSICSENYACCHTEVAVADQTFNLVRSRFTDTRPTSPSSIMPDRVATEVPFFKSLV